MNKQIQLRGISRTPSDRMSADGGCAESLNVYLKDGELTPMPDLKDVTAELGLSPGSTARVVYIHKTEDYTNYILLKGKEISTPGAESCFFNMESNEELKQIKSIGNTLLILTTKRMEYVLYKNGKYHDLGSHLPEPKIGFEYEKVGNALIFNAIIDLNKTEYEQAGKLLKDIEHAALVSGSGDGSDAYNFYNNRIKPELQAVVRSRLKTNRAYGQLSTAVSLRYAYKMYNGETHACYSAPVIIDPLGFTKYDANTYSNGTFIGIYSYRNDDNTGRLIVARNSTTDGMNDIFQAYKLKIIYEGEGLEDWSDIIKSVDFYTTGEYDLINFELYETSGRVPKDGGNSWVKLGMNATTKEQYLDKLMKAPFYKFHSIAVTDLKNETIEVSNLEDWDPDILSTKERLKNDVGSTNDIVIPSNIEVYNKRLLVSGAMIKHADGYYQLPSAINASSVNYKYVIRYYINSANGDDVIVQRGYDITNAKLGPWLFYPSTRCYKAEVFCKNGGDWTVKEVSMTEHPYLNGAYGFLGLSPNWTDGTQSSAPTDRSQPYESRSNRLIQSISENPFVMENEQSFTGRLMGTAVITKPLSTGQFGYANIYVFTDDGIYALTTEADGSLGPMNPVSQDVAIEGTICQLDQAIAFTSRKGAMLLRGSDITCISEKMNGRHYSMEEELVNMLSEHSVWGNLAQLIGGSNQLSFKDFIKDAKTVFDYTGNRLLYFHAPQGVADQVKYTYVYELSQDSWHKVAIPNTITFMNTLNSYPDAYISVQEDDAYKVLSCSEVVDLDGDGCKPGIIVTRPITFDADDVRKVINHLKIRGLYESGNVQYILQASMDGRNWRVLGTLRGGSYNMFRIIVLTNLTPSEKVSYIDIDYETRFTQRMR